MKATLKILAAGACGFSIGAAGIVYVVVHRDSDPAQPAEAQPAEAQHAPVVVEVLPAESAPPPAEPPRHRPWIGRISGAASVFRAPAP